MAWNAQLGFEMNEDAWCFHHALEARLAEFNLTQHPEKPRLLRFAWYAIENCRKLREGKPEHKAGAVYGNSARTDLCGGGR